MNLHASFFSKETQEQYGGKFVAEANDLPSEASSGEVHKAYRR